MQTAQIADESGRLGYCFERNQDYRTGDTELAVVDHSVDCQAELECGPRSGMDTRALDT